MIERRPLLVLLIVVAALLAPVAYVGSYVVLVDTRTLRMADDGRCYHYRWCGWYAERLFWPVEKVDRQLRPAAWSRP